MAGFLDETSLGRIHFVQRCVEVAGARIGTRLPI